MVLLAKGRKALATNIRESPCQWREILSSFFLVNFERKRVNQPVNNSYQRMPMHCTTD